MSRPLPEIISGLDASEVKADRASTQLHDIANGPVGDYVETDSGTVPTVAEWYSEREEDIGNVGVLAEQVREDAQAVANAISIQDGFIDPPAGTPDIPSVGQPDGEGPLNAQAVAIMAHVKQNREELQKKTHWVTPDMFESLSEAFTAAKESGSVVLFSSSVEILIPAHVSDLQDALTLSSVVGPSVTLTIKFQNGHRPTRGAVLNQGDFSQFQIVTETGAPLVLSDSFNGENFLSVYNAYAPLLFLTVDCNKRVQYGLSLVWGAFARVMPGFGVINASLINVEVRGSRADLTEGIFSGAGDVGVRVQQASTVRAQSSIADNCGRAGFEISRASSCNVMQARARNCGHSSPPSEINQGGLVVRRSLVAANNFDGSMSTNGVSAQQAATIAGQAMVLEDCTLNGLRAVTSSRVDAGNTSFRRCVRGADVGPASTVDFTGSNFSDCTTSWTRWGSGSSIVDSGCTYSGNRPTMRRNSPSSSGLVYDSSSLDVIESGSFGTVSLSLAKDTATSIPIPGVGSRQCLVFVAGNGVSQGGVFWMRAGGSPNSAFVAPASSATSGLRVTTGVLTGTTGEDGRITLSVASDGRLYIENRTNQPDIGLMLAAPSARP